MNAPTVTGPRQWLPATLATMLLAWPASTAVTQSLPITDSTTLPRFDVASVKPNPSEGAPSSRFPLGPGDAYEPGNLFSASNQPLIVYLRFAFGKSQGELLRLPSWIYDERFDIQARAPGKPTKADMRLMVRALLVDRFTLAWHVEEREQPVYELMLATPGRIGPQLVPHRAEQPCTQGASPARDRTFEAIPCGSAGLVSGSAPGRSSIAGRGEPLTRLAALLSNNAFAGVDRAVIERTGLTGIFDFVVEWTPGTTEPALSTLGVDAGPSLGDALRQQLGLTLRPGKARVQVPVIDHIERPAAD